MSFQNAGRAIQRFIADINYRTPAQEMIDAVLEARRFNTTIREEMTDFLYGPGKLRQLKISYYPIQCDVIDDTRATNVCATGTKAIPVQNFFTIEDFTKSKAQALAMSDIRLVDGNWNVSEHAMMQINATLGALRKGLSIQMTEDIVAHKGVHLDGSEFGPRVNLAQTTDGLMTPIGYWTILKEQNDGGFSNSFTVGHTQAWNWRQSFRIATDNNTLGQNFRAAGIERLYYDVNLNYVMGVDPGEAEYILTFDPEALKFVSYNRNVGIFATDFTSPTQLDAAYAQSRADFIKGTFLDPVTGLMWDFYARYNPCPDGGDIDGEWVWWLQLEWDIVYPIIQACNIQGVNGIMLYKTCPTVLPDCPTGTTPSPVITPVEFSWTPGSIYGGGGLYVATLNIGGVQSEPGVLVANITELAAVMNANYQNAGIFSVSGSDIVYTGYTALTGDINGAITITFAI